MSLASSGGGSSGNASASKKSRSVPKCDICAMKDGVVGKRMLTCSVCGVHVHGECYGEAEETIRRRSSRWTCHACGWVRASPGRTRPRKCVLCSVDHGVHAMHPLYDTYGKRGKHATLPNGELAWVHSLCAVMIGSSALMKGCVFACDKKGRYDGDEEDSDEEDSDKEEEEEEEEEDSDEEEQDGGGSATHHFVICDKEDGEHSVWSRVIEDARESLRCQICGKSDRANGSASKVTNLRRIPMQCTAGNEHEFPDLKERHRENIDFDCFVAMHVGCARWGVTEADGAAIKHRRTYFCPCRDPVLAEMYCNAHAAEIAQNKPKKIPPPTRPPSLPPKCPLVRPKPSSTNPKKDITAIFSTDTIVSKITKDVLHHISCAEAKKKSNLPEVTKERKKYWKNKMEGESDKFREIWSLVKKQVLEHRKETTETQNDTKMSTLRRGSSDESEGSKRSSGAGKIRQRSSESFAAILDDKNPRKRGSDSSGASIGKAIMASLENMGGKERRGSNSSIQYIAEDGGLKKRGSNESLTSLRNGESKKRRGSNSTILSIAEDEEPKRRGSDESFTSLGNGENKKRRGSNTSIPSIAEDEEIKRRGSITSWSSLKNGTGKKRRASNSSIPSVPEDKKSEKLWSNESFTLLGNGENKKRRGSNTSIQSIAEDEEPKKPGINESIASTGMKLPPIPNDDEGSRQHIAMEETEKKGSQDFSTSLGQKLQDDLLGDILGHPRRRSDSLKAVNDPVVPDIEIIDVDADDEVIIDPPPQEKNSKGSDIGAMLPSKDLTYNNMHTAVTEKERKKVLEMSRGESMTQDMAMGGGMPSSSTGPSMDRAESWESGGSCGNGPAASNLLKENGFSSTNAGTSQELSLKDVSSSDMEQQLEPLTETNPFLHLFVPYFQGAMYDMSKMWEITEIIHHGLPPDEI